MWRRRDDPDLTDDDRWLIDDGLAVYAEELYVGGVIEFQLNDKQVHGCVRRHHIGKTSYLTLEVCDPEGLTARKGKSKKKTMKSEKWQLRYNHDDEWEKFALREPMVLHTGHGRLPTEWNWPRWFYEDRAELEPESERRAADERRAHDRRTSVHRLGWVVGDAVFSWKAQMEKIFVFKDDEEKALRMGRICVEIRTMTDDRKKFVEFYSVDPALALTDLVQRAYVDQVWKRDADDYFALLSESYGNLEEATEQTVVYADGRRLETTHVSCGEAGIVHRSAIGLAHDTKAVGRSFSLKGEEWTSDLRQTGTWCDWNPSTVWMAGPAVALDEPGQPPSKVATMWNWSECKFDRGGDFAGKEEGEPCQEGSKNPADRQKSPSDEGRIDGNGMEMTDGKTTDDREDNNTTGDKKDDNMTGGETPGGNSRSAGLEVDRGHRDDSKGNGGFGESKHEDEREPADSDGAVYAAKVRQMQERQKKTATDDREGDNMADELLKDLIAETAEWALGVEMANVAIKERREERATNKRARMRVAEGVMGELIQEELKVVAANEMRRCERRDDVMKRGLGVCMTWMHRPESSNDDIEKKAVELRRRKARGRFATGREGSSKGSATGSGSTGTGTKVGKRTGLGAGAEKSEQPRWTWQRRGAATEKRQWRGGRGFLYIARLGDAGRLNRERG